MKGLAGVLFVGAAALPLSLLVTMLIHPLWRSFENVTGIEAYGHSGPAGWCYLVDYVLLLIALLLLKHWLAARSKPSRLH